MSAGDRLRQMVREYRHSATTEARREEIRAAWAAENVANQFAAMSRAADLDMAEVIL